MQKKPLNWLEIKQLLDKIANDLKGSFVERVFVPERTEFPGDYLKNEWVISFRGTKSSQKGIWISLRSNACFTCITDTKSLKPTQKATRSPFDLNLSKHIKGCPLVSVQTFEKERVGILWFQTTPNEKTGLVLLLIPARPEAYVVSEDLEILIKSRGTTDLKKEYFKLPEGNIAPVNPPVRENLDQVDFVSLLEEEAILLQKNRLLSQLKEKETALKDKLKKSKVQKEQAESESDWKKWADLLKANLNDLMKLSPPHLHEKNSEKFYVVLDYETDEKIKIPKDPKRTLQKQMEHTYQLAKRKEKRLSEALIRLEEAQESLKKVSALKEKVTSAETLKEILSLTQPETSRSLPLSKKSVAWTGKTFHSKEGLPIRVGRNLKENLELTLKLARGNDVWLHVKGKPSSHGVIHLNEKRSASLESLLDAAHLVIYYSGGESWGKTEVDYTFKKHVKRIKGSDKVRYTHNKTLMIDYDPKRMKRLLAE